MGVLPELKKEIYDILNDFGADPWLLGIIGSWYDQGHSDEDTLKYLKSFRKDKVDVIAQSDIYSDLLKDQYLKRRN